MSNKLSILTDIAQVFSVNMVAVIISLQNFSELITTISFMVATGYTGWKWYKEYKEYTKKKK